MNTILSRRQFVGGAAGMAGLAALGGLHTERIFAADKAPEDITLALVLKSLNITFFIGVQTGAQKMADQYGVNLETVATQTQADVEGQMKQIEDLIAKKVDALLVTPNDSKAVVAGIKAANEAGIPFILVDTPSEGGNYQCFVGTENYGACRKAGLWMGEKLGGKGKVAVIEGIPGNESTTLRVGGFNDEMAENFPDIEIVASLPGNYEMEPAMRATEDILTKNKELDAIFATSDDMAKGTLRAVEAAGRKDEIIVLGYDGQPDAIQLVMEGRLDADCAQKPVLMGELSVDMAMRAIAGKQGPVYIDCGVEIVVQDTALDWIVEDENGNWVLK